MVLVLPGHLPAPPGAQEVSPNVVRAALPHCLAEHDGRAVVMQLYRAVVAPHDAAPRHWTEGEIMDQLLPVLRTAFERRRLVAYGSWAPTCPGSGAGPGQSQPPQSKPPPPKPPPTKPPVVGPPKIEWVQLVSVTIHSDHQLMKDNKDDWLDKGTLYPEPEWTPVQGHALSHDMDRPVGLTVELVVGPSDAVAEPGVLEGKATDVLFESEMLQFEPGPMTVTMTSQEPLVEKIQQSHLGVSWDVRWWKDDLTASVSPSITHNTMYVTADTPRVETWEDGVTHKRMKRAVQWAEAVQSADPHAIVAALFQRVPNVVLYRDDDVPAEYHHPTFFNEVGGAWPLTDYPSRGAECQAIVRMVRAVVHQLGIPGTTQAVVVWADPDDGGQKVHEAEHGQGGLGLKTRWKNGYKERAKLADSPVEAGQTYLDAPGSPGMNNFEACLKYDHAGKVVYHGPGIEAPCPTIEEVIEVFWGLVWIREHKGGADEPDSFSVTEIVSKWK